ncbi:MAG TPA: type II toxin-antitoxin system VapC family toxin [Candidatus Angelobacter sp.]|jgi:predicted nucleic acid-binding protein|nr:type II toxin-antitoxin system VapC family toxin [Candidatus Angelobacter sp.]
MATEPPYLVDTNILLRLSKRNDPKHNLVENALDVLTDRGAEICCTPQNISEFWNVCTRPGDRNGFGLSIEETDEALDAIERTITVLPDNERIYRIWRALVVRHRVSGVQVHDARLAAAMEVHGISHILTLNLPDFVRYSNVSVVHPQNVPI